MKAISLDRNNKKNILSLVNNSEERFNYYNHEKIVIPLEGEYKILKFEDISHIQADGNYIHIFLTDRRIIIASKTLKWISQKVNTHFLRVHQSYLVNLNYVKSFNRKDSFLLLEKNYSIAVSRSYKKQLLQILSQ